MTETTPFRTDSVARFIKNHILYFTIFQKESSHGKSWGSPSDQRAQITASALPSCQKRKDKRFMLLKNRRSRAEAGIKAFVGPCASLSKFRRCAPHPARGKKRCSSDVRLARARRPAGRASQCGRAWDAAQAVKFCRAALGRTPPLWSDRLGRCSQ